MKALVLFYILVLVRILAFFTSMPIFNQKKLPAIWKVGLAALITLILMPLIPPRTFQLHPVWITAAVIWEGIVGLTFGLLMTGAVGAVLSAGTLLDTQMGFANAGILNPGADQPEPLIASFYKMMFLLCCLVAGFHLALLRILLESFSWFPVGMIMHNFKSLGAFGMAVVSQFFVSIMWLVLPICLALLTVEVCVAFLSRLLPQMNMLIAAAPFRVLAGLILVALTLPMTLDTMSDLMVSHLQLTEGFRV